MDDKEALIAKVLHLRQVEKLSQRQIASSLGIDRKWIVLVLKEKELAAAIPRKNILDKYMPLIAQWYNEYPRLMAKQVYERLKSYDYNGGYKTVVRLTKEYRKIKKAAYHALTFLPGQEAQVDWFFFKHERLGKVAGFLYVLSFSRYAWGIFYPRHSFEFFLAGHLECFKKINGLAHCHRYDNLNSVVLKHTSEQVIYNPQFLDFARYYSFSIHACNKNSGNEKGRVERIIRDIRYFLYGENFVDLADLNRKLHLWLDQRNNTVHRSTGKTPTDLLTQEKLIPLALNAYLPRRIIMALASKTALVEFDTNKYSVPTTCVSKTVEIIAYPDCIEICLAGAKVARHKRCFGKQQTIQNPLHAEKLLKWTPKFKSQRILELMMQMDESLSHFLTQQEDDTNRVKAAHQLFTLLRSHSKAMLISAVKELNSMRCFKLKALLSLLNLPQPKQGDPLWPQNKDLLNFNYEERNITDYDELT